MNAQFLRRKTEINENSYNTVQLHSEVQYIVSKYHSMRRCPKDVWLSSRWYSLSLAPPNTGLVPSQTYKDDRRTR